MAMEAPLPSKRCKLYWEASEQQSILQLMLGSASSSADRSLVGNSRYGLHHDDFSGLSDSSAHPPLKPLDEQKFNDSFELDSDSPLPPGWEKCLDLKTGNIYYLDRNSGIRTSHDPRRRARAIAHQPPSPSSSELTTEPSMKTGSVAVVAADTKPVCKRRRPSSAEELESDSAVDLTLSLGPSRSHCEPQLMGLLCQNQSDKVMKETVAAASFDNHHHHHSPGFCRENHGMNTGLRTSHHQTPLVSPHEEYEHYMNLGSRYPVVTSMIDMKVDHPSDDGEDSMITAGCPHCLMFVMLSRSSDPRCPKCGASLTDSVTQIDKAPPFSAKSNRFC